MNTRLIGTLLPSLLFISSCAQVSTDFWKDHLISYGDTYCQSGDNYYDAARVYYQLADFYRRSEMGALRREGPSIVYRRLSGTQRFQGSRPHDISAWNTHA